MKETGERQRVWQGSEGGGLAKGSERRAGIQHEQQPSER